MPRESQGVGERELEVLEVLWQHGPSTMKEIAEQVYPDGRGSQIANVQKMLERLETKKYVQRRRTKTGQRFSARVEREALIDDQLRSTAEKFCGGSLLPLFSRLLQAKSLSAQERQELRELIDRLDQERSSN